MIYAAIIIYFFVYIQQIKIIAREKDRLFPILFLFYNMFTLLAAIAYHANKIILADVLIICLSLIAFVTYFRKK